MKNKKVTAIFGNFNDPLVLSKYFIFFFMILVKKNNLKPQKSERPNTNKKG